MDRVNGLHAARHRLPIFGGRSDDRERADVEEVAPASYLRLWGWTAVTGLGILLLLFGGYEVLERTALSETPPSILYGLHIARGMGSAVILGTWAFFAAIRTRRHYATQLERSVRRLGEEVMARTADLERSHAFTEHLFDTLHDRIVVTDAGGRVVKVNRVARDSIPQACERACGSSLECGQACRFPEDGVEIGRLRRDPHSGRVFEVDRYPVPNQEGGSDLVLEVARDVTEAKRLEALVVHQEKMASLGVLAAGIAHDIGNPLASIASELEMLELEDDPSGVHDSLGVLREHVDRMGRALREMVDFARRRGEDEQGEVCVATAIDDALRLVRSDQRLRGVTLEVELDPGLRPVRMVEDHLVLVIVNLALNALDAMPEGGCLRVHAESGAAGTAIRVSDTGSGIPRDVVDRVFDPLFTTKGERGGTGLGLSVSQSVVRAAGGQIEICTGEGQGTDVTIHLRAGDANG